MSTHATSSSSSAIALLSAVVLSLCTPGCGRAQGAETFPDARQRREAAIEVREVARSWSDTLLTEVTGLDVDSRGRIYVGDWMAARVAVLDSTGTLVRTLGRKGLGPGEFRSVRGLQVLPGDSLMVYDPSAARLSVFPPDGDQPAYTINLGATLGGPVPFLIHRTPTNDAFVALFRPGFMGGDTTTRRDRLQVLNRDGTPRAEPFRTFPSKGFLRVGQAGSFSVTPDPFGSEGLYAFGRGGEVHYLWNDSLHVETYDLAGGRTRGFRVDYTPPEVTDADVEAAAAEFSGQAAMFREALQDSAPPRWPAARAMLSDADGRLWIGLHGPASEPSEWASFDADGTYRGSVFLPSGVEVRAFRGNIVYGVQFDAADVPQVVVYRMAPPAGR
ncbi:MAG TPA: 6-bladed beta-propeller [Longimicrobium sp.]|nr:6-bladed beta-propeller [Longimicrobium sp.]